ncbi:MAG: ABC-ATPase domain-containing protein, partial [Chloroflexota bacterium]|nr:ABC-ATPase domain-containing protein [Chloroflexota bacterium]
MDRRWGPRPPRHQRHERPERPERSDGPHDGRVRSGEELRAELARIDRRPYPAYKDLRGAYALGTVTLFIDHIQGDPFAAPSRVRVRLPRQGALDPA